MQPRYINGIYRDCKFCGGKGCLACPGEAEKEYKRQFQNGPKTIATFNLNNPESMKKAKMIFGKEAIENAFSQDGGGMPEIMKKLESL